METIPKISDATANGIAKARAYFSSLAEMGVAPVLVNDTSGDVFFDVTIEGVRFQAFAKTDPYVARKDRGDWCQLGVASIQLSNQVWMVCKYSVSEGRIDLSSLSDAGRRAFAITFGVPIGGAHDHQFHESFAFYASNSFDGLIAWARRRPRKFKGESGISSYVGDWKSLVSAYIGSETLAPVSTDKVVGLMDDIQAVTA